MSSARQFLVNILAQGLGRALSMGANLLAVVAVARLYGAEVFGQFAYAMAFLAVAASLADLNTTSVLAHGLPRARNTDGPAFIGNFLILRGTTTATATLLALVCALFVNSDLAQLLLLCSLAIPFVSTRFVEPLFQVYERPWYSAHVNIVYATSHVLLIITVLWWARWPLHVYLAGFVFCHLSYSLVAALLSLKVVVPRLRIDRGMLRSMFVIAAPLGVGSLFYMVNNKADIFMLEYLRTSYDVGIYSAAQKFLEMQVFVALAILTPAIPILSRKLSEQHENVKRVCAALAEAAASCTVPIAVAMPFIAAALIELVFGSKYSVSAELLPIFAWVAVLAILSLVCTVINLANGKVAHAYWNTALATTINIALNLVLIPRYGILGAAYATVASHLSLLLVNYAYVVRNFGNVVRLSRWALLFTLNAALFLGLTLWSSPGAMGLGTMISLYIATAAFLGLLPVRYFGLRTLLGRPRISG